MNLVFLGPPGSGKGTQAKVISKKYNIAHLSTGDILRKAVTEGTRLGLEAKTYMDKGKLVPDAVILGIINENIAAPQSESGSSGFLLDGFPRTIPQAEALEDILKSLGQVLQCVINISVDDDEVVRRLSGRRVCETCGAIYHIEFELPKVDGTCDKCDGKLYQRDDDKEEIIRSRLDVYKRQTEPLFRYYSEKDLVKNVKGTGSVEEITQDINEVLKTTRKG